MSQVVSSRVSTAPKFSSQRTIWLGALLALVACAAVVLVIALDGGSSDTGSSASVAPASSSVSGPNEAARGQAAATGAGVVPQTTGIDESSRGVAAATAANHGDSPLATSGGPDETARGQAAAFSSGR